MTSLHLPERIEHRSIDSLLPYARNSRTHTEEQIEQIVQSIQHFGWTNPVLVGAGGGILAGHARVLAARKLGLTAVPVIVLGHLSDDDQRALVIADNQIALNAGWNAEMLRIELTGLRDADFDMSLLGFDEDRLRELLADVEDEPTAVEAGEDAVTEVPAVPVTRPGDVWLIGPHRLICGDCRDPVTLRALLGDTRVNVAITSPPYATQREYDSSSGFKPVPPDQYVEWFCAVAAGIESVLVPTGSYFLNIKAHADDGERHLYVMDLVIAHRRKWGWLFVDEFCWRKTDNGVPGGWNNRFKNAFEPIYHFSRQGEIKFNPLAVGHESDDCFDYSRDNPKSTSGSGLLGTGARGSAAGIDGATDADGRRAGIARPSNVIEVKSESSQGSHSAPYPRELVEFFIKAFSDPGDVVFDPFMGSGTTMAAAQVLYRAGCGCEISPGYCDVILRRMAGLVNEEPVLEATEQTMADVAADRGVPLEQVDNPKLQDARRIQHRGPNPQYGSSRKAS